VGCCNNLRSAGRWRAAAAATAREHGPRCEKGDRARGGLALYRHGQVLHSLLSPTPHCCRSPMRNRRCNCAECSSAVQGPARSSGRVPGCGQSLTCRPVAAMLRGVLRSFPVSAVSFSGTPGASVDREAGAGSGDAGLERRRVDRRRPASSQTPQTPLAASGSLHEDMAKPGFDASTLQRPDPRRWNPASAASFSG
jgi:hypothetical protein